MPGNLYRSRTYLSGHLISRSSPVRRSARLTGQTYAWVMGLTRTTRRSPGACFPAGSVRHTPTTSLTLDADQVMMIQFDRERLQIRDPARPEPGREKARRRSTDCAFNLASARVRTACAKNSRGGAVHPARACMARNRAQGNPSYHR